MGGPSSLAQYPRQNFPLAEYMALVPGANIALGPRLGATSISPVFTVPGGGFTPPSPIPNVDVQLTPSFGYGDAIYLVIASTLYIAAGGTGQELTIVSSRLGFGTGNGNISLDIAPPIATQLTPGQSQNVLFASPFLVTYQDLQGISGTAPNLPLFLETGITMKNTDPTNPHTYQFLLSAIWHTLKGLSY